MGGRGIRSLKVKMGLECSIFRVGARWARLNSGGIQAGAFREVGHSVCRCEISKRSRGTVLGVRSAKSSEYK